MKLSNGSAGEVVSDQVIRWFCIDRLSWHNLTESSTAWPRPFFRPASYYFITTGGPLTRFPLRSTVTSTRSAIVTKGIPLFIP